MFNLVHRYRSIKIICSCLLLIFFSWGLGSCTDRVQAYKSGDSAQKPVTGRLLEVSPPPAILQLRSSMAKYQPQVTILSPQPDQVFQDTNVSVRLQVRDLPIFQDPELKLGPHLNLLLDDRSEQKIYHLEQPILLENLSPGTHTLRVFASRPWFESFKNEGSYAQTTFHILTKTDNNNPDPSLPLLTYNSPTGSYGAEPILLDFYLTNAPLHMVARENPDIADWRIRVTVNGESFTLDEWQPSYLKGFQPGNNWVKLEFIDENGNKIDNAFNDTVKLITYAPNGQDSLSQLVRGELPVNLAMAIADPDYRSKVIPSPTLEETPVPEITETKPSVEETPIPETTETQPPVEETPPAEVEIPTELPAESNLSQKEQPVVDRAEQPEVKLFIDEEPANEPEKSTGEPIQIELETPQTDRSQLEIKIEEKPEIVRSPVKEEPTAEITVPAQEPIRVEIAPTEVLQVESPEPVEEKIEDASNVSDRTSLEKSAPNPESSATNKSLGDRLTDFWQIKIAPRLSPNS